MGVKDSKPAVNIEKAGKCELPVDHSDWLREKSRSNIKAHVWIEGYDTLYTEKNAKSTNFRNGNLGA